MENPLIFIESHNKYSNVSVIILNTQLEKKLEMKKWSRNGKVIKQGIGMCMMFSQCNTCSMGIYLTIQYQGVCGHIII